MNCTPAQEQSCVTMSNLVALGCEIMTEVMGVDIGDQLGGKVIDPDTNASLVTACVLRELQSALMGRATSAS